MLTLLAFRHLQIGDRPGSNLLTPFIRIRDPDIEARFRQGVEVLGVFKVEAQQAEDIDDPLVRQCEKRIIARLTCSVHTIVNDAWRRKRRVRNRRPVIPTRRRTLGGDVQQDVELWAEGHRAAGGGLEARGEAGGQTAELTVSLYAGLDEDAAVGLAEDLAAGRRAVDEEEGGGFVFSDAAYCWGAVEEREKRQGLVW